MPLREANAARFPSELAHALLDGLYPPVCALCPAEDAGDGLGCAEHRFPVGLPGPRCGRCAAPLAPALPDGERCAACRLEPPPFRRVLAVCDYRASAAVRDWLLALKYGGRPDLARTLGVLLAHVLAREAVPEVAREDAREVTREVPRAAAARPKAAAASRPLLVPVPLHPLRRLERGYDQAVLLARAAAESAGLDVACALRRVRYGGPQGAILSPARTANVHDAFRSLPSWWPVVRKVAGRDAWLVDDVVTSGATAGACARVLRKAGAASVGVVCVARAAEAPGDGAP